MFVRKIAVLVRRNLHLRRSLQIWLLVAFWAIGEMAVRLLGLPVPGGVIGMLMVLALFSSHRLSPASMRRGANWFLAEMLLFFVPAVPSVLDHREFLGFLGLKVLAVIFCGTIAVMGVTAMATDLALGWHLNHGSHSHVAK
jgi:holin-like protein